MSPEPRAHTGPEEPGLTCTECRERLAPYIDDELDVLDRQAVKAHLAGCPACSSRYDRQRALGDTLRRELPTYRAPDLLRARIGNALRAEGGRGSQPAAEQREVSKTDARTAATGARRWRLVALAASALLVVSTTYDIVAIRSAGRDIVQRSASVGDAIAHDVLASHVRSLMPGHLTDVASSNRHNVKPWFNGRLDYSPPVYDLSDSGFPLIGGRVDYVGNRAVAVLVYQRRQHLISVYVWPSPADTDGGAQRPPVQTRQGYHMLSWTRGGMTCWAISDLNEEELRELARLEQRADSLAGSD
ncbi:MAG TPA: anti-sigma factor [Gemmatimonadaceae bacterium]|nr:anti-sigma factor [Gemmatimonadaceae bacterium]